MGGTLPARPPSVDAPVFVVRALRDPGNNPSAGVDLQRVQIVKGWVDGSTLHEKVYNIAGEDKALTQPERDARVDLATCAPKVNGSALLCTRWQDPDFKPEQLAFTTALGFRGGWRGS